VGADGGKVCFCAGCREWYVPPTPNDGATVASSVFQMIVFAAALIIVGAVMHVVR
jgi:hypothetical protein